MATGNSKLVGKPKFALSSDKWMDFFFLPQLKFHQQVNFFLLILTFWLGPLDVRSTKVVRVISRPSHSCLYVYYFFDICRSYMIVDILVPMLEKLEKLLNTYGICEFIQPLQILYISQKFLLLISFKLISWLHLPHYTFKTKFFHNILDAIHI